MLKEGDISLNNMIDNTFGPKKPEDFELDENRERDMDIEEYYKKLRQLKENYKEWAIESMPPGGININEAKLGEIYSSLKNLTEEIYNSKSAEEDFLFQNDAMERIGEFEEDIFSNLEVMNWPVGLKGEERIQEEKKAQRFLLNAYQDQAEEIIKQREMYEKKYVGQFSSLSAGLMDSYYRLNIIDKHEEDDENFNKLTHSWTEGIETKKLIDINIELIKNGAAKYIDEDRLAILCEQDMDYASDKLWQLIKSDNKEVKSDALNVIYHLELGKINMSADGVDYLKKKFDLGEDNDTEGIAFRATAKGEILVLDKDGKVRGYFKLDNLDSEEEIIKTKMMLITHNTLFFEKDGETPEEKQQREEYLQEFTENYFKLYNDSFFSEARVRFNDLNFKEQGWFLIYYNKSDDEKKQELLEFTRDNGINGLKSFLTMEFDESNGDRILELGNKLDEGKRHLIFNKVAELGNLADRENQELNDLFYKEAKETDMSGVSFDLLQKAHLIIKDFGDQIEDQKKVDQGQIKKLLNDLESKKIEVTLLASVLKDAKAQGEEVDFEMVRDLNVSSKNLGEVIDTDKQKQIVDCAIESRRKEGQASEDVGQEAGMLNLREMLNNSEDYLTYEINFKNETIGFIYFKPIGQGEDGREHFYVGGLNIIKPVQGLNIGDFFMKETMLRETEENNRVLHAAVSPEKKSTNHYIEKLGFRVTGYNDKYTDKKTRLVIELDVKKGENEEKIDDTINKQYDFDNESGKGKFEKDIKTMLPFQDPHQVSEKKRNNVHEIISYSLVKDSRDIREVKFKKAA